MRDDNENVVGYASGVGVTGHIRVDGDNKKVILHAQNAGFTTLAGHWEGYKPGPNEWLDIEGAETTDLASEDDGGTGNRMDTIEDIWFSAVRFSVTSATGSGMVYAYMTENKKG